MKGWWGLFFFSFSWSPTAPHVIYKTDKKPEEPCSITSSLSYFPEEEGNDLNVTSPPRIPPSNLTVVTVEGCPSFVILDWQKADNETTGRAATPPPPWNPSAPSCPLARPITAVENVAAHLLPSFRVRNSLHHPRRKRGGAVRGDHQSDTHGCGEPQTREQVCLRRSCTFILTPYTLFMCKHCAQSFNVNFKSQMSEFMSVLPSLMLT